MRKLVIGTVIVIAGVAGFVVYKRGAATTAQATPSTQEGTQQGRGGMPGGRSGRQGGGMGGAFARPPMTVEVAQASRAPISEHIVLVGNLIGAATVQVSPKVSGRLQVVRVRLGDSVRRGQRLATIEDNEIREQVRQAEASFEVARATIRQREADLKLADINLERSRNLFARQLLAKQTMDDADARYSVAQAQLDLSRAQFEQSHARLQELRIALENTVIVSPVDGFVSKRNLDPGAFASPNAPVVSVVDIHLVRMVANLVEKDLRRVVTGTPANVEVDAFPGEVFEGRVARVAPVLEASTRTAEMEVEVPNPRFRLKPGMYARVRLTVDERPDALVVPRNALVDIEGARGVFVITGQPPDHKARFVQVETGLQDDKQVEIRGGLSDGVRVATTGAAALRDGDTVLLPSGRAGGGRGRAGGEGMPRGPRAGGPASRS